MFTGSIDQTWSETIHKSRVVGSFVIKLALGTNKAILVGNRIYPTQCNEWVE